MMRRSRTSGSLFSLREIVRLFWRNFNELPKYTSAYYTILFTQNRYAHISCDTYWKMTPSMARWLGVGMHQYSRTGFGSTYQVWDGDPFSRINLIPSHKWYSVESDDRADRLTSRTGTQSSVNDWNWCMSI